MGGALSYIFLVQSILEDGYSEVIFLEFLMAREANKIRCMLKLKEFVVFWLDCAHK